VASTADVSDMARVRSLLRATQADLVINAASKTHSATTPNIDGCLESPYMRRQTLAANALGAGNVALACAEYGCQVVHLSSGCIFEGDRPFNERSVPNPPSFYARTKAFGEQLVSEANDQALIVRLRMPISAEPHPRNLLTKLSSALDVVDVTNSVTVVEDLLPFVDALAFAGVTGVVHAVNPEPVTFRDLMARYRDVVDASCAPTFIPKWEYRTVDGRSNCVLVSTRELPAAMPPTQASLERTLAAYAHARVAA
jgi:dTDP-4-dehydrorhamnose reductase